ncbi:MAG: dihydrofolate reductase [Muribaculaceae bacterium]|nr:dihydrofolate reductase [Muribaculaceae bacterium]
MEKRLSAIVAIAQDGAIGRRGELLCHLPADLRHFRLLTTGHTVIMGRRTADSLPKGALPDRQNIVVTRSGRYSRPGFVVADSLEQAVQMADNPGEIFVIGGAQIYAMALEQVTTLHVTLIHHRFDDADVFFPDINADEWVQLEREDHAADEKNPYDYSFVTLWRISPEQDR